MARTYAGEWVPSVLGIITGGDISVPGAFCKGYISVMWDGIKGKDVAFLEALENYLRRVLVSP